MEKIQGTMLVVLSVALAAVSLAGALVSYESFRDIDSWISGYVTQYQDNATVDVVVSTNAAVNFTTDSVNWGTGNVQDGMDAAVLDTLGNNINATDFSTVTAPLVLENIGNQNMTLNITANVNAESFIGGNDGGGPLFQYNYTNSESNACTNSSEMGVWYDFPNTDEGDELCSVFDFASSHDELRIDVKVRIPSDSLTSTRSAVVTAFGEPL